MMVMHNLHGSPTIRSLHVEMEVVELAAAVNARRVCSCLRKSLVHTQLENGTPNPPSASFSDQSSHVNIQNQKSR
jgi:hypothetical protein